MNFLIFIQTKNTESKKEKKSIKFWPLFCDCPFKSDQDLIWHMFT